MAIEVVTTASRMPSGISLPPPYRMAGLVIRWPTLRTNISERPCSVSGLPSGAVYSRSGVQAAGEGLAALGDLLGQRALQDAQPVAVGQHLVLGVHHGHRIFQVQDGGERGFQHQVADAGGIALADGVLRSIWMSMWMPLLRSSTDEGAPASPW